MVGFGFYVKKRVVNEKNRSGVMLRFFFTTLSQDIILLGCLNFLGRSRFCAEAVGREKFQVK